MPKRFHSRLVVLAVLVFLHLPILAGVIAALVGPIIDTKSSIAVRIGVFLFGLLGLFLFCGIAGNSWNWWKSLRNEANSRENSVER